MDDILISHEPPRLYKHTHVLIDRVFYPEPPENWKAEPVINSVLKPQVELYPWLISLENLDVEQTENLVNLIHRSDNLPAIMLLHSDYRGPALIQRLADSLIFQQHYTSKRYLLRYYDSRVFIQLIRMLTRAQLRNFCLRAGVNFFSWINSFGGETFTPAGETEKAEGISSEVNRRLLNIGMINTVIQQYNNKPTDFNELILLSEHVEKFIDVATMKLCLTDRNDIISFAVKGLTYHHLFYLAEPVAELIKKTKSVPGLFASEIELLNENDWVAVNQYCQEYSEKRE